MSDGNKNKSIPKPDPRVINRYMMAARIVESGGNPTAQSKTSSAFGQYQFTDSTWKEVEKMAGRKFNKNNPGHQGAVMRLFTEKNAQVLAENGLPLNENNLYALHHFGTTGGLKAIKEIQKNPNASASKILGQSAANANKALFFDENNKPVSISKLFNKISGKISDGMKSSSTGSAYLGDTETYSQPQQSYRPDYMGDENLQENNQQLAEQQQIQFQQEQNRIAQAEQKRIQDITSFMQPTTVKFDNRQVEQQQDPNSPATATAQSVKNASSNNFGLSGSSFDLLPRDLYADNSQDDSKLNLTQSFKDGGNLDTDPPKYGTPEYAKAWKEGNIQVLQANGEEVPYWGGELDEVPIQNNYKRQRGFWEQSIDKFSKDNRDTNLLGALAGTITYPLSIPQHAMTYLGTKEVQDPSEALGIKNKYSALAADIFLDPVNLTGAGALSKEKIISKLSNLKNINIDSKLFNGINNTLNDMSIKNIENYMSKRTISDDYLPKEFEPYLLKTRENNTKKYIQFEEDEYMKWFNEKKNKKIISKPDDRSILRKSSIVDINDDLVKKKK